MEEQKTQDYGYEENAEITISGKLFNHLCMFLEQLGAARGTEIGYLQKNTLEELLSPDNKPQYFMTQEGLGALTLITNLNNVHKEHIEKGIAKPIEELEENKPKISLAE